MTSLARMGRLARYNVLTPFATLAAIAFAAPVLAATIVVDAPDNDGVELTAVDDALINNSDITNVPNDTVVYGNQPVDFITNAAGATITGNGDGAVGIDNNIGTFTNHGTITTDTNQAVGASGVITTFLNTGTITSTDPGGVGVGSDGGFGTFINTSTGVITGAGNGFATGGNVTSFTNAGTITGGNGDGAGFYDDPMVVGVGGSVGSFLNSGTIQSTDGNGVYVENGVSGSFTNAVGGSILSINHNGFAADGDVEIFSNAGTIAGGDTGVGFFSGAGVMTFTNAGNISGTTRGVHVDGTTGQFTNAAGGVITATDEAALVFNGQVTTFSNSGTISGASWDALFARGGVTSFTNETGGIITNTDAMGNDGNGVAFETDLVLGGAVEHFANYGTISGAINSNNSRGVAFFEDGNGAYDVTTFLNAGTISGMRDGVLFDAGVGTFTNTGTILGEDGRGVQFNGLVTSFSNSGDITSFQNGVSFGDGVTNGSNSGNIVSTAAAGEIGVRIDGMGGMFNNSGVIEGAAGVVYILGGGGSGHLTNSGTIRGTAGSAIEFDGEDDSLTILTGSKIFGDINFDGGNDVFDFADFRGNTLLQVYDLEDVEAGSTNYVWDQPNNQIAIFDLTSTASVGSAMGQVVGSVNGIASGQLDGLLFGGVSDEEVLSYAPAAPVTAAEFATEEAVLTDLDIGGGGTNTKAWASVFGGGSGDADPVELSNVYGGIIAGAHTQLTHNTRVGVLAGYVRGHTDVMDGQQTLDSDTGLLGIYGRSEFGIADLDFSLLGGYSAHRSEREIVALGGTETATADFSSWFISPSLGVEVPVLVNEKGEVSLTASASYVGGRVAAYDESGSSMDLSVGGQTIGVFDGRVGMKAETAISDNEHGSVQLQGNAGLFGQSNFGSSNVAVSVLGQTVDAVMPNSSGYGVYAGIGLEAAVGHNVTISGGLDASLRDDGVVAGGAKAAIGASF